jgi:hypothetical protein
MRKLGLFAAAFACFALYGAAAADPVDNPGPFNLNFDSGSLVIGQLAPFTITSLAVSGQILDTTGAIDIPQSAIVLPDAVIPAPFIGDVTVHFAPLQDATGSLNALTGDMNTTLTMRVQLINDHLLPQCGITPDPLFLTSGTDGALTGVPYSPDTLDVTLVNNSFAVPRSDGCGIFASAIDSAIGLPSPSGANSLDQLHGTFDTQFTGS